MCGIAGLVNLRAGPAPEPAGLQRMIGAMRHRGPDESGLYVDDWAGLASARLSIVDLAHGTQPIHNEDASLWIVYNGEVFNHPELREELRSRGHRFYTSTDTEVVLRLFEERGPECLARLNGQFAMAIWDRKRRRLFLARDRMGIRPLHYTRVGERLFFASEAKSLFSSGLVQPRLDAGALAQVFTYWTTLPGRSLFAGVRELPPGHFLVCEEGRIETRRWWDPPFAAPGEVEPLSLDEAAERVRAQLDDAVRIRLRADVPVGCYLSGGLDSSAIATILARNYNHDVRTFGIRFQDPDFDEGVFQRRMVEFLAVRHEEVEAGNAAIAAALPETIWHCERPLLRTAPVPLYLLSRRVRECGFKVVLAGEGGDEIFAGYNIFRETLLRRAWAEEADPARRGERVEALYPYIFKREPRLRHLLTGFFAQGLDRPDDPFFSHRVRWRNTARILTFFSPELRRQAGDDTAALRELLPEGFQRWDPLSKAQYLEIKIFLSNYLLSSQGDRVGMAHSVEVRLPYLDYRLVEFMGRLPAALKMADLCEKHALKEACRGLLPDEIVERPKQPYRAPIRGSLLSGGGEATRELLSPGALAESGLFDAAKVAALLRKLEASPTAGETDSMALVGILSSQLFHRQFLSGRPWREPEAVDLTLLVDHRSAPDARGARREA